ncbi:MAG: three-Cys-motif partner protein TcmP [Candidatus Hodarchaeales archaeon]
MLSRAYTVLKLFPQQDPLNRVNLTNFFGIKENPPKTVDDPVVPMHNWSFEKHHIIRQMGTIRAIQTRKWKKTLWIVDACAGSGVVFNQDDQEWYEGSPLLYANIIDRVHREFPKGKGAKKPDVRVIAIESRDETFKLLKKYGLPLGIQIRRADCNNEIKDIIDDEIPQKEFTHIFIDPFNMGDPPIQSETVKLCLSRPNTELVLFYPWNNVISRLAGYVRVDDPEKAILTGMKTLTDFYFGDESWKDIELSFPPSDRRNPKQKYNRQKAFVEFYKEKLKEVGYNVSYVEVPIKDTNPKYYLFFAANQLQQRKNVLRATSTGEFHSC